MCKKLAVIVGVSGFFLIAGTLGAIDNEVHISELYKVLITLKLILGGELMMLSRVWYLYLERTETIRNFKQIRGRRCIEELKEHPHEPASSGTQVK